MTERVAYDEFAYFRENAEEFGLPYDGPPTVRRESVDLYRQGNREELAAKEEAEIAVIERFLPAQMSEEEAKAAIAAIVAETGASSMKDMGKVMALVKERHPTAIEPARASGLVRAALAGA